jgi:predicted nucleic-acid-binding protein
MIALDTDVLVRFLTGDDPEQARLAGGIMAELTSDTPGFICREVLVELVWVLERAYRYARPEVADAIAALLAAAEIRIEDDDDLWVALLRYRDDGLGLADLRIAAAARSAGASELVTFDRKAARISGVRLLGR